MKNTRILNYSMVFIYTLILVLLAVLAEAAFDWAKLSVPDGLVNISLGLAETGFSVTVIAVSILTVITNMSEKRYFGIKAGEYLKFRRQRLTPAFYDNLIVIILIGALQYAALAVTAVYASTVMFIEIITMMILQVRWGLGIAFFYYGKEKEIRTFFLSELEENLRIVADGQGRSRRKERAILAVRTRIDNLFTHTKHAASVRDTSELEQNLGMMAHLLKILLEPEYHKAWRNYETRVDYLLSSLMQDEEHCEYALKALSNMTNIIMDTMSLENGHKTIAQNCDFDQSRNSVYKLVSYANTKTLRTMFDEQIFYKLTVVKIYGIKSDTRKIARYAHYTEQFAEYVKSAKNTNEVKELIVDSIARLSPECFTEGKITEAALYTYLLIDAIKAKDIILQGLYESLEEKAKEIEHENKKACIDMLISVLQDKIGKPQDIRPLGEVEQKTIEDFKKLLSSKPENS